MGHGIAWQLGGTAGEGVESGGEAFASALGACGYLPTTQRDFPSRIRGGDTTYTVRLTPDGLLAPPSHIDLAIAFNATVIPRMDAALGPDSLLLLDDAAGDFVSTTGAEVAVLPLGKLAVEAGDKRAKNVVALGASAHLLGIPIDELEEAVADQWQHKGPDVVAINRRAVRLGADAARERFGPDARFASPAPTGGPGLWISGNEAACLGALAAGCRLAAAYPITPASDILEYLTPRLAELGGAAIQVEDEIAALNIVLGAGYAGAKALTATSGPGVSLMTETMALSGGVEVPAVVIDCQRPGPSTGMPTKHGQEDLWHLVHGGHGESPRIVLAPIDVADAFRVTSEAFRLAWRFRAPAFVALDQQASLFKQVVAPFDLQAEAKRHTAGETERVEAAVGSSQWAGDFVPYAEAGPVAAWPTPGSSGGIHVATSTEHGPSGFTNEVPKVRDQMLARRAERLEHILADADDPIRVWGPDGASVTVVSWGSTVGACREAAKRAAERGISVRVIAARLLWPFPRDAIKAALGDGPIIVAEANATGQFARLLRSELPVHDRLRMVLRNDGTPVRSDDVLHALEGVA